jgi:hypothetical protein
MPCDILCKHCGQCETHHEYPEHVDNPHRRVKGYRRSLLSCSGYVPETEIPESHLSEFEQEALENRARSNAAWGLYGAHMRQAKFDREVEDLDKKIQSERGERREAAIREKADFIDRAERNRTMHIGFY